MDTLTARPNLLKQANLSLIRRVIKNMGTATRAEIAAETKISSTTVRSLLSEMIQNGELESIGYDRSSGGRKAERYRFRPDRYYGAAICINDSRALGLLVNLCGEIVETTELHISEKNMESEIFSFLDDLIGRREIKSIGIGVPGIVENGCYWRMGKDTGELYRIDIGDALTQKYRIPVIMENDLNATAIGFGRCYTKEFPCENPENINMAYLHFEKGCVSAGFIMGGRIIRGCNNFAGELGLIPMENGRLLDQCMAEVSDDIAYVDLIVKITGWICGILNPQYILLGGPDFRKKCLGPISDTLSTLLPEHMHTEILYASNVWHDYQDGMAHLTAGKIFDDIQFIKE